MLNYNNLKKYQAEIKISLEDEGLLFDQATTIGCLTHKAGLKLNMKVGGAEAISDIRFAHMIGCSGCVAPMIESKYALHKFISSIKKFDFSFDSLYINIESKQAYNNIEYILNSTDSKYLKGIVLGRTDFIQSFGLTKDKVDSIECRDMIEKVFTLAKNKGLTTLMGGNINHNSKDFIKYMFDKNLLDYIETRNVKIKLNNNVLENFNNVLHDILLFESEWLELKSVSLDKLSQEDKNRLHNLKTRNK
jgi:hypothetical protein